MIEMINKNDWPLFRMIIPVFELNVFSRQAKEITALGPIAVATAVKKLYGWRVEVINENNCRKGPKDSNGLLDHVVLQKERPATVVGFYCGLTSTMERVWDLAEFYHQNGVFIIAGGWHAHYCPEETLAHNVDVVVHGDGEEVARSILNVFQTKDLLSFIPGISFINKEGQFQRNDPGRIDLFDLNDLPYPDFSLARYARIKYYPISRIRGCSQHCEFCSVKGKPRWSSPEYFFNLVVNLVKTRKAKHFFIVDDRLEEDSEGTIKFFNMVANKYGSKLHFTVQIRLEVAENTEFLEAMKRAGVRRVCVGCESPIDEDLKAMHKGYTSSKMLEWLKILRGYFKTHIMLIVGYPWKIQGANLGAKEIIRRFRRFIYKAHSDSVHVMLPGPAVGTDLRRRLKKEGRIFPLDLVPWSRYDGNYVCFKPDNMSVRELQEIPEKLMSKFYDPWSFIRIPLGIIPGGICLIGGWGYWYRGWYRDLIKYGGHRLLQQWQKKQKGSEFIKKLEEYQSK